MNNIGTTLNSEKISADSYTGIKDIFKKRDEVTKIQDAEIEEAKQTKARKAIEVEMKAVTALIRAGEIETEMGNNHYRASIDTSQRKRSMDCPSPTK